MYLICENTHLLFLLRYFICEKVHVIRARVIYWYKSSKTKTPKNFCAYPCLFNIHDARDSTAVAVVLNDQQAIRINLEARGGR